MHRIELTNGGEALVDAQDAAIVSAFSWRAQMRSCGAVSAVATTHDGKTLLLHRILLDAGDGEIVDHADGNPLNNQRTNLRRCTHAENMRNRKMHRNNSSGCKGVYLEQRPGRREKWVALIRVDGRKIQLGRYETKPEAALAYKIGAYKYHGEFARTA